MYYANKFHMALDNIRKTWDIIKNITLGCNHVNSQPITEIKVDNNLITDSNIMTNNFKSFSQMLAQSLQMKVQKHMVIFQIIWAVFS